MAAISGQNTQVLVINNNSGSTRTHTRAGPTTSMAINLKVRLYLVEHFWPTGNCCCCWLSAALSGGSIKRRLTYSTLSPPDSAPGCIMPLTAVISWNIWQPNRQANRQRKSKGKGDRKNINSKGQKRHGALRKAAKASVAIIIIIRIITIIMIMIIIKLLLFLLGQYFSFVAIGDRARVYLPSSSPAILIYLCMPHTLKSLSEWVFVCVCAVPLIP